MFALHSQGGNLSIFSVPDKRTFAVDGAILDKTGGVLINHNAIRGDDGSTGRWYKKSRAAKNRISVGDEMEKTSSDCGTCSSGGGFRIKRSDVHTFPEGLVVPKVLPLVGGTYVGSRVTLYVIRYDYNGRTATTRWIYCRWNWWYVRPYSVDNRMYLKR